MARGHGQPVLNGLLPDDGKLDQESMPKIMMPNRDGFVPDPVFKIDNEPALPCPRGARSRASARP